MKKSIIYMLGMGALLLTSCREDIEPAIPQFNEQGPVIAANNVTSASAGALSAGKLTLENYTADGAMVPVMKLVSTTDLPETATVSYQLVLSNTDDFARSYTLDTELGADGNYSVSAEKWNDAHLYLFGKSPKEKTAYYRVPVYVNFDASNYRLGGNDYYAANGTITETCMDQGFVIADGYYLLGNATSWDMSALTANAKFEHSDDVSVYDDPVFKIKFEVTQAELDANGGGCYWKIAPDTCVNAGSWDGVLGTEVNGDTSLKGTLVSKDPQAGEITEAGKYRMTINMEAMTYELEKMLQPDVLYTPGGANGWNQKNSAYMQLSGDHYYGVFPIKDGFKVCAEPNWDNATTYGAENSDPADSGKMVQGQAGANIVPSAFGVYWMNIVFDPATYEPATYTLIPITQVGLIGGFEASGWSKDVVMETADEGVTYTAEVTLKAGDPFKFRFNGGWDYNLGGDMKQLTAGGDNITADEAGTYTITLNLQGGYPHATMTKK